MTTQSTGVLRGVLLQMQSDSSAAAKRGAARVFRDGVGSVGGGLPDVLRLVGGFGGDGNLCGVEVRGMLL